MRESIKKILAGSAILAAVTWIAFPGTAYSDVKVKRNEGGGAGASEIGITTTVNDSTIPKIVYTEPPGCPVPGAATCIPRGGGALDTMTALHIHGTVPGSRVYASGVVYPPFTYPGPTPPPFTNTKTIIGEGVYALLNAGAGGGTMTSTVPDTLFAGVGLYAPGVPQPNNMLRIEVDPQGDGPGGTQDQIVIKFLGGAMQTRIVGNKRPWVKVRVGIYESPAAAAGDPAATGVGAAYFGSVDLVNNQLVLGSGMSPGDWTVSPDGVGFTATPAANLTKSAPVPDKNQAVVLLVGDPVATTGLPGQSPIGLVVLTVALMASGFWIIRRRRSVTVA